MVNFQYNSNNNNNNNTNDYDEGKQTQNWQMATDTNHFTQSVWPR